MFERVAATTAVMVLSVAWVTHRYPAAVRTSALVGLWSGALALTGMAWATIALGATVRRRLRPGGGSRDPILDRLGNVAVRVFWPMATATAPAPLPAETEAVDDGARRSGQSVAGGCEVEAPARNRAGRRHHVVRALTLLAMSVGVAWSGGVLGPTWQPLCAGSVEALAVAAAYRLSRMYHRPRSGAVGATASRAARPPAVAVAGSPGGRS